MSFGFPAPRVQVGICRGVLGCKQIKTKKMNKFEQKCWAVVSGEIEEMTYGEFLSDYYSDKTTSPRGIEPKLHIAETDLEHYDDDGELEGVTTEYTVCEWLLNGRKRDVTTFETREEANDFILECWEENYERYGGSGNAFFSYDEAFQDLCHSRNLPRSVNMHKINQ